MSSDFCAIQEPFYPYHHRHHSNPIAMFNSDALFLSDSSVDSFLQEISEEPITIAPTEFQNNLSEAQSLEELAQTLFLNPSPNQEIQSLSVYQQTQFTNLQNSPDFTNGIVDCPVSGIKMEGGEFQLGFDSPPSSNAYLSGSESYGGDGEMVSFLQRSCRYGGHSYDGMKQGTLFQPPFGVLSDGQFEGHLRRVFSTGDLPKEPTQRVCSSLSGSQSTITFMEEPSFKVGKYSPEEKKERIDRYKAKRGLRNFNKTIKYACRKTLADSRPRIRGRFARNDEPVEVAKSASGLNQYEYEGDHWAEGLNEGVHQGIIHGGGGDQRGHFFSHFGQFGHEFIGY